VQAVAANVLCTRTNVVQHFALVLDERGKILKHLWHLCDGPDKDFDVAGAWLCVRVCHLGLLWRFVHDCLAQESSGITLDTLQCTNKPTYHIPAPSVQLQRMEPTTKLWATHVSNFAFGFVIAINDHSSSNKLISLCLLHLFFCFLMLLRGRSDFEQATQANPTQGSSQQ
jgi:hypothetical protein